MKQEKEKKIIMYPIEKYKFFNTTTRNGSTKIIAVTTYAGKTVRGVAICHPEDKFDEQKGKEIAAARCAVRVAKKREARAEKKYAEANRAYGDAVRNLGKMNEYCDDACVARDEAEAYLENLLKNL